MLAGGFRGGSAPLQAFHVVVRRYAAKVVGIGFGLLDGLLELVQQRVVEYPCGGPARAVVASFEEQQRFVTACQAFAGTCRHGREEPAAKA